MIQVKMPLLFVEERFGTGEVKRTRHVADVWVSDFLAQPGRIWCGFDADLILGTPDNFQPRPRG